MIKRKGISLVALVITIIVLIILTGTVIATFMEGGIIDKARRAVELSDYTTLIEAYDTNYNTKKIEIETGTGGKINKKEVLEKTVKDVGMNRDFEFVQYAQIVGVTYKGKNIYIQKWLEKILSDVEDDELILANGYLTNIRKTTTIEQIEEITGGIVNGIELLTGTEVLDSNNNVIGTVIVLGETDMNSGVGLSDANTINFICENYERSDLSIYASDINGDGYVSLDDVALITTIMDPNYSLTLDLFQKRAIIRYPNIENERVYEEGNVIEELKNRGFKISKYIISGMAGNIERNQIVVKAGTTYAKLEQQFNDAFNEKDMFNIKTQNKSEQLQNESQITIETSYKIRENKCFNFSKSTIKVVLE